MQDIMNRYKALDGSDIHFVVFQSSNKIKGNTESTKFNFSSLAFSIKQNIRSVKQGVLLSGLLSIVLGFIIWIFLRDISQIGLFDEERNLVGIAKLATPVKKTEDREFTFKLKLDF